MSYNTIAAMTGDFSLRMRLYACAGQEGVEKPVEWVDTNIWKIVSNSEMSGSYQYALDTEVSNPGRNEGVISDSVILAHVQPLLPATP